MLGGGAGNGICPRAVCDVCSAPARVMSALLSSASMIVSWFERGMHASDVCVVGPGCGSGTVGQGPGQATGMAWAVVPCPLISPVTWPPLALKFQMLLPSEIMPRVPTLLPCMHRARACMSAPGLHGPGCAGAGAACAAPLRRLPVSCMGASCLLLITNSAHACCA